MFVKTWFLPFALLATATLILCAPLNLQSNKMGLLAICNAASSFSVCLILLST